MGFKKRLLEAFENAPSYPRKRFIKSMNSNTPRFKRFRISFIHAILNDNHDTLFELIKQGFFVPSYAKRSFLFELLDYATCHDYSTKTLRKVIKAMFNHDNENPIPMMGLYGSIPETDEKVEFMMEPMFCEFHNFHLTLCSCFAIHETLCQNHFVTFMNRFGQTPSVRSKCKKILENGNFNRTFGDTLQVFGFFSE